MSNASTPLLPRLPALMLGAGLLVMGSLQAAAFALASPVNALPAHITRLDRAVHLFSSPALYAALAGQMVRAAQEGEATWPAAEAALREALRLNPQDPLLEAQLAYALMQQKNREAAAQAMADSLAHAPFMPGFMVWRFGLALALSDAMSPAGQESVAQEGIWFWRKNTRSFIRLSRLAPFAAPLAALIHNRLPAEEDRFLRVRGTLRHTDAVSP